VQKVSLKKREKLLLTVACIVLVGVVGSQLLEGPLKKHEQSKTDLQNARLRLEEVRNWDLEIQAQRANEEAIRQLTKGRSSNFNLVTFLNLTTGKTGLQDRAELESRSRRNFSIPEGLDVAELTLRGVSIDELISFLHEVYAGGHLVAVYKMDQMKPMSDPAQGLECQLTFVSPK